jgi:hypothetical protein
MMGLAHHFIAATRKAVVTVAEILVPFLWFVGRSRQVEPFLPEMLAIARFGRTAAAAARLDICIYLRLSSLHPALPCPAPLAAIFHPIDIEPHS